MVRIVLCMLPKHAVKLAKDENAQLFLYPCYRKCTILWPYRLSTRNRAVYKDLEDKVQSWFDKVKVMARDEGIL